MPERVLVLDANQRSALAITRSLGKHSGIAVITSDDTTSSLAGASRFSSKYLRSPSAATQPDAFIDWLTETIRAERISQIFPATEISTYTCLMHEDRLKPCKLPFPGLANVQTLSNKCRLMELATDLGIPHPESRLISHAGEFDPRSITRYPVVLKPCYSRIWLGSVWLSSSVHTAACAEDVSELVRSRPYFRDHPFMIQEFIPGTGAGVFALYQHGNAVVFFSHTRIREKPPTGGVSVLSESARLDPHLVDLAKRLLDRARWHGVAMVEFRMTPDGTPYLMEVNPRFWGSLQLPIDCGIDFPRLLFELTAGLKPLAPDDYPAGRRLRWLLGDLDSLYLCLRDRERFSLPEKISRILSFIRPRFMGTRHEIDRIEDLGPARHELFQYVLDALGIVRPHR